jgi:hypothetical protein
LFQSTDYYIGAWGYRLHVVMLSIPHTLG